MFFKLNIHQIFFRKYPKCSFQLCISYQEKHGPPLPVPQRGRATRSPGPAGSPGPASSSGAHPYIGTVCMLWCRCVLDIHIDRQLLKKRRLKELTESIYVSYFARAAGAAVLFEGCFPLLSSAWQEDLVSFQSRSSQPALDSVHSQLLPAQDLARTHIKLFLVPTNTGGGY